MKVLACNLKRQYDLYAAEFEDKALQVLRGGGRTIDVPVTRDARRHGRSGFRSFYDGSRILARMVTGRIGMALGR